MRKYFSYAMIILLLQYVNAVSAQQLTFNHVLDVNTSKGSISDIAQDQQGYIWLSVGLGSNNGRGGVYRYDGSKTIAFLNDPTNQNSLANNWAECLAIDSFNIVWIGTFGSGLDKYDPATNKFTHFKHDPKNTSSLNNDTVTALLEDHQGNLWVGTYGGLNLLDRETGKFRHYANDAMDPHSLSNNHVRAIYEDHHGTLWIGCGSVFLNGDEKPEDGGLNRFDRSTGTFKRYLHDPSDPNSIVNNKVRAMFEDSKGNFWVGTAGDGLHIMDSAKETFAHYYFDSTHPEKLSRPPFFKDDLVDHITFIHEDITGCIWIGSFHEGINKYDPNTKKITHYGSIRHGNNIVSAKDTSGGFDDTYSWAALTSKGGLLWISTLSGNLYNVNPFTSVVKYFLIKANANSFYKEPGKNVLWIATEQGLIRKDMNSGNVKTWRHDPRDINGLCNDSIGAMRVDDDGDFWLATNNGLCKFDPNTNHFTTWRHNEKDKNSLSSNLLNNLFIDHDKNIWIATFTTGLDKLDTKTGAFTHFQSAADSNSLVNNSVISVCEDPNHTLWIGTQRGISRLENNGTKFKTHLKGSTILNIYVDAKGIVWAGAYDGLYRYDGSSDQFMPFTILGEQTISDAVLNILEDNDQNLWVAATYSIIKINRNRDEFKIYGEHYGVHKNTFFFADNFKASDGELFMGDQEGYYAFFPNQLEDNNIPPQLSFSGFRLGDEVMQPGQGGVLKAPVWLADEIKLKHDQNIFSFDFIAMRYGAGEIKYLFMLENYDNTWHNIGTDHTAYFFNVRPGNYIFHAKVISIDGTSAEKTIRVIIMPPWWQTWWAYCIYGLLLIGMVFTIYRFTRQRIIEKEQEKARAKELAQAKEIEKAYHNLEETHAALKATQSQLIQSEKMASLGELTAGIAHEIQNPLNFVNNFSELNNELVNELKEEAEKGNIDEVKIIADDIKENSEKINHHGKRADAIVKGMLQHSKASTGKKELTDINKLADEYLRLAYHGLRAKDKSFNADFTTRFDESLGKIDVIPADIGRVFLNLFNNAFYAVNEKSKSADVSYQPVVLVQTKKLNDKIEIIVSDNGNGIPQKVVDKIFQPFFTTKPTGQGTGLGLSLSYDIVKAHGGEITVKSKEGQGSEFSIMVPA